jgi:predicted metal-dependent phosphoesterase TrpH
MKAKMKMTDSSRFIKAEFHCHTVCSLDSSNRLPQLLETARARGLSRLAITDHNKIGCALKAHEMAPDLVVVGEEILTRGGELLGYFLQEEIPARLSPLETIERLKKQGAFIAVPHPFDIRRHGWKMETLLEILPYVDALEVFNARCLRRALNDKALAFAREHQKLMQAGSDAHSLVELGLATVELPAFTNADELREAMKSARINGQLLSPWDHFKASAAVGFGKINPFK